MYHSLCCETAAIKADTQSGHFSGFSTNISRHLGSNKPHRFSVCIIILQSFSPFNLIYPHPDPQLRRLDPESERDTLLHEQQWRPFPLMWGTLWQKHQRLLSFTELAWQWKSKSRPLHSLPLKKKKKAEYFYWVFKSGSHSPHLMPLLALYWFLPWLSQRACPSSLLQPRFHSKATPLRSKVTMVEFIQQFSLKIFHNLLFPNKIRLCTTQRNWLVILKMSKNYITAKEQCFSVHILSFNFHLYIHTVVHELSVFHYLIIKSRGLETYRFPKLDAVTVWCIPTCMKIGTPLPL